MTSWEYEEALSNWRFRGVWKVLGRFENPRVDHQEALGGQQKQAWGQGGQEKSFQLGPIPHAPRVSSRPWMAFCTFPTASWACFGVVWALLAEFRGWLQITPWPWPGPRPAGALGSPPRATKRGGKGLACIHGDGVGGAAALGSSGAACSMPMHGWPGCLVPQGRVPTDG